MHDIPAKVLSPNDQVVWHWMPVDLFSSEEKMVWSLGVEKHQANFLQLVSLGFCVIKQFRLFYSKCLNTVVIYQMDVLFFFKHNDWYKIFSHYLKIRKSWSISESPWNKGRLVTISANMQPMLQISAGTEYRWEPNKISGALYHKVTTCNSTKMCKKQKNKQNNSLSSLSSNQDWQINACTSYP